jgi:hypothetical protein
MTDKSSIRAYFLGNASPDQVEVIEMFILDDTDSERVCARIEDDLIEDYLEGALAEEEESDFRAKYLTTNERRRKVAEISLLKTYAARATRSAAEARVTHRAGLSGFWSWRFAAAGGIAAVLIFGLFTWQIYRKGDRPSALEAQYGEINHRDLADLSQFQQYRSVEVLAGTFRDASAVRPTVDVNGSSAVLFRFIIPYTPKPDQRFSASLVSDGQRFELEDLPVYKNGAIWEVRAIIPSSVLHKGETVVDLAAVGTSNSPIRYTLIAQ